MCVFILIAFKCFKHFFFFLEDLVILSQFSGDSYGLDELLIFEVAMVTSVLFFFFKLFMSRKEKL